MTLFPYGLGLMGIFFATIIQMLLGFGKSISQGRREKLVVFTVFLGTLTHLFYLSGIESELVKNNLFVFSGPEICFAIAVNLFFFFVHLNFYFDKGIYERELGLLQLGALFFSFCSIFANHFLVLILSIPMLMMIVFVAPHFAYKSKARPTLLTGVPWAMTFMIILSFAAVLAYSEFHTLRFDEIRLRIIEKGLWNNQVLAIVTPLVLFGSMMLFSGFSFFLKEYESSDSWNLIGQFRMLVPLLASVMICRWILLFGGVWRDKVFISASGFSLQIIPVVIFLLLSTCILIQTAVVRKLSHLLQVFAIQPLLITLWGLSSGTNEALLKGVAGLFLYSVAVPLCLKVFVILDIKAFETIEGGRLALRGASLVERIHLCILLVILSPLGTYIGFSLVMSTVDPPFQFGKGNVLPAVCAASLLFSLVTVLGELFENYQPKRLLSPGIKLPDRIFGNTLMILLITLGIYPSPLYKYVSYILDRTIN